MIYFILKNYTPNTASTNRILGYLEVFDKEKIPVTIYFLLPSLNRDIIKKKYKTVKIIYAWQSISSKSKVAKTFCYFISLFKIRYTLKEGDIVYTYGVNSILSILIGKKNVKYYAETTENFKVLSKEPWPFGIDYEKKIALCKLLNGLFVISTPLKEAFISEGVNANKIHIVNMTVDPNRFDHVKPTTEDRYIAYCGTASNNKDGVDELIKAFALVAKKVNDIKLYIIGNTPSQNDRTGNLALVEELNIKDRVVFTGIMSADDMPQILTNAQVLALDRPDSLQAQCGFPTKLGEYLLTRKPVVVTKVGDIPKFLKDGVSALLAEQRNSKDFAEKILWALENPIEASIIGQKGYEVALEYFNNETETKKIIDVFKSANNNFKK